MPIRKLTPDSNLDIYIDMKVKAVINMLAYVGEQVRNEAIENGSYKDQTGNLRSSVGYLIVEDGKIVVTSAFGRPNATPEGKKVGKAFAESLVSKFPKGIILIVVAGMNYAKYVSAKGYNVLDTSEIMAERLVPQMLRDLGIETRKIK